MSTDEGPLRAIPSVDSLLQDEGLLAAMRSMAAMQDVPRRMALDAARTAVDHMRDRLRAGDALAADEVRALVVQEAIDLVRAAAGPHYARVVNATGIVLHTALGRAPLAPAALRQVADEMAGYSLLQADRETGKRSRREARIESLLQQLTGAEAATVVNNNAAATLIVLNTVAEGREVIVSRGQLVEIGGSFRLPEIMATGGVRLVEVGATNRTHARDYENAVTESTAAILRCHPSNYVISGFSSEVALADLVRIARANGLTMIDDVGAGALIDFSRFGFRPDPLPADSIRTGADLVTSSTDKLIGASQGGIILGRADLVDAVRKNPLARAMRVDKLTLAVLEATLTLFMDEERALAEVPILRMLGRDLASLAEQADRMASAVNSQAGGRAEAVVIDGFSQMGSGSLPGQDLPTRLVAVSAAGVSADELARRLRRHTPPVFTRIREDRVLVDPRTLLDGEEDVVVRAVLAAVAN